MRRGGELLEFPREDDVLFCDASGGVRGEFDHNLVVGVRPIRVVVHLFGFQRGGSHETERFDEIPEPEFRAQAVVRKYPTVEGFGGFRDFSVLEDFFHFLIQRPEGVLGKNYGRRCKKADAAAANFPAAPSETRRSKTGNAASSNSERIFS